MSRRPLDFECFHENTSGTFEPDRPELFDALPENAQEEMWADLAAKCEARNEELRTLDPLYDTSSRSFASLRGEQYASGGRLEEKGRPKPDTLSKKPRHLDG